MTTPGDTGGPRTSADHPPLATRRFPEGVEERPVGWWGMLLTVAVLATTYAAMCFSYVYVRVASGPWPPEGIEAPALDLAAASALVLAASAVAMRWTRGREAVRALGSYRLGLAVAVGLAAAHVWLLVADWLRAPFAVATHAYASLYVVLPGIHAVLMAIGSLVAFVLVLQSFDDDAAPQMRVATRSLVLYWYTTAGGGLALLAIVYLMPHVWRSP